jgi:hypothetical protein
MKLSIALLFIFMVFSNGLSQQLGRHTLEEWQTIIDTTWGEGLSTDSKLALFDNVRGIIDNNFACFQGLPGNILDSLTQRYRPEIQAGVSNGRYAAIMNYFAMAFKESHTWIFNNSVNFNTALQPGVPLFVIGAWTDNSHFGATLTPLPDSSLLVIKTLPNHPLGLVPGDVVVGYDGIPWKILYKEILAAQFPLFPELPYCTTDKAYTHDLLKSAGMNWHLFNTIDVLKYSSGDTLHLPTNLLDGQSGNIAGNEQLSVPGVPFPDINWQGIFNFDIYQLGNYVSWGIINDTNIGYIYVYAWFTPGQAPGSHISEEFYTAVNSLMNDYRVEGLIFDQRFCFGGGEYDTEDKGFSLLFNSYIETIAFAGRCGAGHFQLCPDPQWNALKLAIPGNPGSFFDRPIAVLTGPGSVSQGDIVPLKMTFHPMSRVFGKSTSGAFSAVNGLRQPAARWLMFTTDANAYLVSNPGTYLSRTESHVDEEVWLTREDVAKGEDTVVKRAVEWMQNLAYAHDVSVNASYIKPGIDTVLITAQAENPNDHAISLKGVIRDTDLSVSDDIELYDDGLHSDGSAGDKRWGNFYIPPASEHSFAISVTTQDQNENTTRTLPRVAWFTTKGPLSVDHYEITSSDTIPNPGDRLGFKIYLKNSGQTATIRNIEIKLTAIDTCAIPVESILRKTIDSLASKEIKTHNSIFTISINSACSGYIPVRVDMYEDAYLFWMDTLFINVEPTGIADSRSDVPDKFALKQNYPNPFNPSTTIEFQIPNSQFVSLKIYNILGEEVATLISKKLKAGSHTVRFNAAHLASGVYLYRLTAGRFILTKKLVVIR